MNLDDAVGGVGHGFEEIGQGFGPDPIGVEVERFERTGGNCIKIGLPGKLILRKRKGLPEVLFS